MRALWLGRRRYEPVLALQDRLHAARRAGRGEDTVLFVEHEPVLTLGRGASTAHILAGPETLAAAGIAVVATGRGGDVTLHAPGQLVAYPILELAPGRRDVRRYVNDLTEVMRRTARDHGVDAGTVPGMVGLWVDRASPAKYPGPTASTALAKIGALGIRLSRWVSMHGFALNLTIDLGLYRYLVPCGISEYPVSSLAALVGVEVPVGVAAEHARGHLAEVLQRPLGSLEDRAESPWAELVSELGPVGS